MVRLSDQLCDQWQMAWDSGAPIPIESLVQTNEVTDPEETVARLILLELDARRARGERPTVGEFRERFPQFGSIVDSVFSATAAMDVTVSLTGDLFSQDSFEDTVTALGQECSADRDRVCSSAAVSAAIRQKIGRYTVLSGLGRGGQAEVYRGVHPTLPIEVAIKLAHESLPESQRLALQQEAHILCDLDHPQIARIRDFDFDDGHPFLVLDFIRGRSLSQLVSSQSMSAVLAAELVAKVARGIDYAHSRGVLHRDLKPDNVVIDEHSQPKIIDFGMSRMRSGIAGAAREADEISGTLAYMAPEQAAGISSKTDHRVDIFALGAILYRLLVGKAPYPSLPVSKLLESVRRGDWDAGALEQAQVPEELKAICRQAMNHDSSTRYATAADMATELETYVATAGLKRGAGDAANKKSLPASMEKKLPLQLSASGLGCAVSLTVGLVVLVILPGYMMERVAERTHIIASTDFSVDGGKSTSLPEPLIPTAPLAPSLAPTGDTSSASHPELIGRFQIVHIGNSDNRAEFSGSLLQFRSPQENDDIQVQADFNSPLYCFLVALNPDGGKQLLYPSDAAVAQSAPITSLRYPADEASAFGLTDGIGQQAFVLFTSKDPLPAYDAWDSELVHAYWPDPEASGNWRYSEGQLQTIDSAYSSDANQTRGIERKTMTPTAFKQLCDRLRSGETTDAQGVLFEVKPRL